MKSNKILLTFISILLLFNQFTLVFAFAANDIAGHWAEKTIIEWQSAGKINGYEDNSFRPDAPITRAEFVHLLNNIITLEEQNSSVNFSDVNTNDWFYTDIAKAVGNHIIAGFEDNTFRPNEMITRAQSALIVSNALQLYSNETNEILFTDDSDIPIWSKNAVYAMSNAGYLCGYEDGNFAANKNMTRAEAISMLDRIDKDNKPYYYVNETSENNNIDSLKQNADEEEKTPIKMVWENGDTGFSISKKEETKKVEEDKKTENILTITKDNITEFYGKTLQYKTVKIILDDDIELLDMKFTGNVEIISNIPTDTTPTLYLKGNTNINHLTTLTPVIINSENNIIKTLITKAEITVSGNTYINHLECYNKTTITDNTIITNTAQIFSDMTADSNTEINSIELMPNTDASIFIKGIIYKINAKEKGSISSIHLGENANASINISNFVTVENITLSDNAKCYITIQNNGKLNELFSTSRCFGTTVKNHGTIDKIIACNTETITAENTTIETAILQNITLISQPNQLHYKEGETLSLSGISLLLQYQNNIIQIIDNIENFPFYHVQTTPVQNTILTAEHHNKTIKIYSNEVYVNTHFISVDYIAVNRVDTEPFAQLIQICKNILNDTLIQYEEFEVLPEHYYVNENDFVSFENMIFVSEELLQQKNLLQQQIQKQYDLLQSAYYDFEEKRTFFQKVVSPPVLSVSNTTPQYGEEEVLFAIENIQPNTTYYYTLDNSEPTTESTPYTEPVTLLPPQSISQTPVTIKAIALQDGVFSAISEKTVTYSAALPIDKISLYNLKIPYIEEQTITTVQSNNETQYSVYSFCWKTTENDIDEIVNLFEPETTYIAEIILKANKPYAFQNDAIIQLQDIPDTKIQSILLDEQRSDANYFCILVTFEPTPPIPTEEIAIQKLNSLLQNRIDVSVIDTDIPSSEQELKDFCCNAISKSAEKIISDYWKIEFNALGYIREKSFIAMTGKFTIISTINPSISVTAENYIDVTILIEENTSNTKLE